jgi:hypothetical protein
MSVDLHMHTTASDGVYPPAEVIAMCADRGLKIVAISDHDTTSGIEAATAAAGPLGLRVLPAIEINTDVRKPGKPEEFYEVHVLGFFIDYKLDWFQKKLETLRAGRTDRIGRMLDKLRQVGITIDKAAVEKFSHGQSIGRPHVGQALVEAGHARDVNDAFDRWLTVGKPGYAPRMKFEPEEAITTIAAAGGIPVLAHPGLIGDDSIIASLVPVGLKGLEVYHPSHDHNARRKYEKMAKDLGIGVTGGSDFHGTKIHAGAEPGCSGFTMQQFEAFCALNGRECLAV